MCEAASKGNFNMIQKLVKCVSDVNVLDYDNRTPLHIATSIGNKEIVELLINNNADPYAKDKFNRTPIFEAEQRGYKDILKILKKNNDVSINYEHLGFGKIGPQTLFKKNI